MTAGLNRWPKTKYLPTMDQLLEPGKPRGKQSTTELLAAFQGMKAAGAPMRIRKIS